MSIIKMVYDFLSDKNGWDKVSTEEQLKKECEKRRLIKRSSAYYVSDLSLLSTCYSFGSPDEQVIGMVKEVKGNITEYYTKPPKNLHAQWVALDINTNEILEYYLYDNPPGQLKEMKYSKDGELLQVNYAINKFEDMPEEFKTKLTNFPYKENIFGYAHKPYGMIIEAYHKN